jgi:type IV pilus assembly protein PilY1
MGVPPPTNAELPNVLIVIDNTANWNTAFAAEMAALASTVSGLEADKIRLGFMMYSESGGGNKNPDGAYVRAGVRTMTETNKGLYEDLVKSFHDTDDKSNNGKLGLTMSEVERYFSGKTAYAGANKVKRDYSNNEVKDYPASTRSMPCREMPLRRLPRRHTSRRSHRSARRTSSSF